MGKIKDSTIPEYDQYSHDTLCYFNIPNDVFAGPCTCTYVARIREDEQNNSGDRVAQVFSGDWPGSPAYLVTLAHLRKSVIAAAMDDREYVRWDKP
jgi:hypothetical protein